MKDVEYAGGRFTTSDAVAAIVLEYASELANVGRAAALAVPAVSRGEASTIDLLVGPASQLMVQDSEIAGPDLESDDFVADVRSRIDALRSDFVRPDPLSAVDWDL